MAAVAAITLLTCMITAAGFVVFVTVIASVYLLKSMKVK